MGTPEIKCRSLGVRLGGMRCVLKRNCLVNLEELEERKQNFLLISRCQDQILIKLSGNMT